MSVPGDEHERTLAFAEIALGQIRSLRQPVTPRNFEIWYHYATGYNQPLNQSINETLAKKQELAEADLDEIYNTYIAPARVGDRIDAIGDRMLDEINQAMAMIEVAADSATSYSESLADANEELKSASTAEALRGIVEDLVKNAKEMELSNKKLEARLSASRQEIEELQVNLETVRAESFTDPLTTLFNRKYFDAEMTKILAEAKDKGEPLSLLMTDIDHFKQFNDKYGHLTGDQVLRLVAVTVKQNVKGRDIAARYGGEEFVIALPNTELQPAMIVAQHIRQAVMTKELLKRSSGERLGRVTVSIGAASLRPGDTIQTLVERADGCLYAAKRGGRNRVIGETDTAAGVADITRVA